MTQEDKELLLRDLCARLPYGVICQFEDKLRITDGESNPFYDYALSAHHLGLFMRRNNFYIKPYLRPMSSMTEEEKQEYDHRLECMFYDAMYDDAFAIDWLNKKMFDFRGLIEKGLAISTEEFNPYKD